MIELLINLDTSIKFIKGQMSSTCETVDLNRRTHPILNICGPGIVVNTIRPIRRSVLITLRTANK